MDGSILDICELQRTRLQNASELPANRQRSSKKNFISIQLRRGCGFQTFPFTKGFLVSEKRIFNIIFIQLVYIEY
jgi:hypothetical protein